MRSTKTRFPALKDRIESLKGLTTAKRAGLRGGACG
jgi:hypothetical protein